jgi:hypothetical chaperone protein
MTNSLNLGIDFGTTNSSVAFYHDHTLTQLVIDPENDNQQVLPSLIFVDKQHASKLGAAAALEYLERETGRPIAWRRLYVGTVEITVGGPGSGPITYLQDLNAMVDSAAVGRLLQSIKTMLRDPEYDGTRIFDRFYTIDELIALVLASLKANAERSLGAPCTAVVLGRPVKFSDDGYVDRRAEEILYKAALWAGFDRITFAMEPLGVAYLHHVSSPQRHLAFIFDFGGGTLDFTLAELGGDEEPNILATHGVLVGGDDLDKRIMGALLKHFGADTLGGSPRRPFPPHIKDSLLNWQTMPELSKAEGLGFIREFKQNNTDPRRMEALEALVTHNLGFKLFREIERVKKALSTEHAATLEFHEAPIHISETFTRTQFENLIAADVKAVNAGIEETFRLASVAPEQVEVVLRTGGSSLIPAFGRLLANRFGEDKLRQINPLTSIVGGMAVIADRRANEKTAVYAKRYETPDHMIIQNICVATDQPCAKYPLRIGEAAFTNTDYVISRLPVMLSRLPAIRLSNLDREYTGEHYLEFELRFPARVWVAYDATTRERPHWLLSRFEREDEQRIQIKSDWYGERALALYSAEMPAGIVRLGGAKAAGSEGEVGNHYLVVIQARL